MKLDVLGLVEFADLLDLPLGDEFEVPKTGAYFRIEPQSDARHVLEFFKNNNVPFESFLGSDLRSAKRMRCLVAAEGSDLVGASILTVNTGLRSTPRLIVHVRQDHPLSSTIVDHILSDACAFCSRGAPARIEMLDISTHAITRRIASRHGFRTTSATTTLAKVCLGRPITAREWPEAVARISRLSDLSLPSIAPRFDINAARVQISNSSGAKIDVSLYELETLFSPTLFALAGREAVIVPITRTYAADLIGSDDQLSLLQVPEAGFLSRRVYFNTPRAERVMKPNAAIVFYESTKGGGRKAAIAVAKIVDVTSFAKDQIPSEYQRAAVVDDTTPLSASDRILCTTFECLIPFKRIVPLELLRDLGCVDASNLITARTISDIQLAAIVEAGWK